MPSVRRTFEAEAFDKTVSDCRLSGSSEECDETELPSVSRSVEVKVFDRTLSRRRLSRSSWEV
jgi:hypothetical protein